MLRFNRSKNTIFYNISTVIVKKSNLVLNNFVYNAEKIDKH